jgi:hypothetical protein
MTDHRPRSSYEPNNVRYSKVAARRAVRTTIGQELKARYEVPRDLPHKIRTLLREIAAPGVAPSASPGSAMAGGWTMPELPFARAGCY